MILNVGMRTDLVNYYGEWLENRFRAGFVYSRNPLFPNKVTKYLLSPDKIDAILFCSKNYAPFLHRLEDIARDYRLYCHYTITAYGRDVEPNVPDLATSVETLLAVEKIVGKERLAWRYDPVLLTPNYSAGTHLATFERLCRALAGHVDRCIFSFVDMYAKLERNMPELIPLTAEQKTALAKGLGEIAGKFGIPIQTCGEQGDYSAFGIQSSACVTLGMLGRANHCTFGNIRHLGNRRGCSCIQSRDIGWYDTCPNGCRYCYANKSREAVKANIALHDPSSPLLIGNLLPEDTLIDGNQTSFLKSGNRQISLFDL